ncbi:hypothetical protein CDD83_5122 [Cordyceps sp. RAO-2017]|nr:hypothetical protein CDD83_5122 [Cordyceps sp. RAO-2017]
MHGANAAFIEVLPEEALRLGFAIRSYQLTQCAFRILVNELALGEAAADTARRPPSRTTLFGRRRGECGDELDNAVQHAARALVDRLSATVARLESPTLFDEWAIRDWAKLRRLEPLLARGGTPRCEGALALLRRLMAALPAAVMAKLEAAARHPERDDEMLWSMDVDRASYVRPRDFERLRTVMAGFNLTQRLLCPFVYNELASACADPPPRRDPPVLGRARHVCLLAELETALQTVAACDLVPPYDDAWDEFLEAPTEAAGARRPKLPLVSLGGMDREVKDALRPLYLSWIRHDIDPPLNMTRHLLLTLTINELKFLPLWAGGLDDGTGGVFGRFVPPTDMGPSGPGPAYHTGRTLPQSATSSAPDTLAADDEFSVLSTEDGAAAASVRAAHGHASTAHGPEAGGGGFSSADDMASVLSDSFTANGTDYQDARIAVPAEHQAAPGPTNAAEEDDLEQRLAALDLESVLADDDFASDVENPFSDSSDSEDSVVVV